MNEFQTSIESIPFLWGMAFTINVILGASSFYLVVRKQTPTWSTGLFCWTGWWAFATSFALVINAVVGAGNPFAYHQIGVFTEGMENLGICAWVIGYLLKNWNVRGEEALSEIETARRNAAIKRLMSEGNNGTE